LQEKLFPGFKDKLKEQHIHCLKCDGWDDFLVILKDTFEGKICTGYIGEGNSPDDILLHLEDLEPEKERVHGA